MEQFKELLKVIGQGLMTNTAYDTAWIARLNEHDSSLSNRALGWICENQLPDGSWGMLEPNYYHDRIVCTLSAMIVLTRRGRRAADRAQIEKGLIALEQITSGATQGLAADPNGATVGFEMIAPTLVREAEQLGIIEQQGDRILGRLGRMRDLKMAKLAGYKINRFITPAFSAEMTGTDNLQLLDVEQLQEKNGSVGNSPAATAHFMLNIRPGDAAALSYLHNIARDGGAPFAAPFDIFERSWVLWNLSLTGDLDQEMKELIRPHLDYLEHDWNPKGGVSFSDSYTPEDGDDTSIAFEVLSRFGRNVDIKTVLGYEEERYFRCYPLEANSSVSVNIHVLCALRQAGLGKNHPSVQKVVKFLRQMRQQGNFWLDKWHTSPFYATSHAVIALYGIDDNMCTAAVDWILSNQQADGAWGTIHSSAEETAYCIQGLKLWQRYGGKVPIGRIEQAAYWLERNAEPPYAPLWIGKVLYCPEHVVKSAILSALIMAKQ
jgi:halimadienyl-diphosphate synthase